MIASTVVPLGEDDGSIRIKQCCFTVLSYKLESEVKTMRKPAMVGKFNLKLYLI